VGEAVLPGILSLIPQARVGFKIIHGGVVTAGPLKYSRLNVTLPQS
jgi:hypothetical protein